LVYSASLRRGFEMKVRTLLLALTLGASFTGCARRVVVVKEQRPAPVRERVVVDEEPEERPGDLECDEAPPPPQKEVIVIERRPSPSHVWIGGHWAWQGRWVWIGGHWHAGRAGHHWVGGHWEAHGRRWVWVSGHWA
jgi:hypothetical protein